jgi:hypothetical protein
MFLLPVLGKDKQDPCAIATENDAIGYGTPSGGTGAFWQCLPFDYPSAAIPD